MSYTSIVKEYLKSLQEQYQNAARSGQYTKELSYRMPIDALEKNLAREFCPSEDIDVILEPTAQGKAGRPDWLISNKKTLAIYGYIEAKGPSQDSFDIAPYKKQIKKYQSLGHKLIITDGIEFIFCLNKNQNQKPTCISIIDKQAMHSADWSKQQIDPRFEYYMREFFKGPSPLNINEAKLIELVAIRTRVLADEIKEFAGIPQDEAMNSDEGEIIALLNKIKGVVYNHNDQSLKTSKVFSDFLAQIIMFSLLYAYRVLCSPKDQPSEKERKIRDYIKNNFSYAEAMAPFRELMLFLNKETNRRFFINTDIEECIKFLSFVTMTNQQLMHPDYHQLFEMFLTKFDSKSRFDYGAYFTPKVLADYVVKLTNYVVDKTFPGKTIYEAGNYIIDPCCGTGSFLEEVTMHDSGDNAYTLCGIEILPAPYMLANYRMAVVDKINGKKKRQVRIVLANSLVDGVFNGEVSNDSIEGKELLKANRISSLPLKLVIGNPPCSDSKRNDNSKNFSIINKLMEDFRPPASKRHGRQNTQKQSRSLFMKFLRWGCKKLLDSPNHSVLAFVVPLTFLENESYKYARKYLCDNFSGVWAVAIDGDARTGLRSNSLFHTLQGRAVIVLIREYGKRAPVASVHFCDFTRNKYEDKERLLAADIEQLAERFIEFPIDQNNYSFIPAKSYNKNLYDKFWPVSGESGECAIFVHHCSGIKLAPTALFTNVKEPMLRRRCREIATEDISNLKDWFSKQDKPPKTEKVLALKKTLEEYSDTDSMNATLEKNIHTYSFRPFLNSNVLLWQDLLKEYSRIGGGGTRLRPEIIKSYEQKGTIGFAMSHAPKDLSPRLSQFVSFCWYFPDNDMCSRGNSYIYLNQYCSKENDYKVECNIADIVLDYISNILYKSKKEVTADIVFYVFAVLCSQIYLDEFEGALFTVNQPDQRARVPIVTDKVVFDKIVQCGKKLAELEKEDFIPENILHYDYRFYMKKVPKGFKLQHSKSNMPFNEENETLLLTDGNQVLSIPCPLSLQHMNISGYNLIKDVWLKFNSYSYAHCEFTRDDMERLLNFLNILAMHERYVEQLDEIMIPVLNGEVSLFKYES